MPMSIEFTGSLRPSLTEQSYACVLRNIKDAPGLVVVRDERNSLGLSFATGDDSIEHEQISFVLNDTQIYVGFHVGTRDQRERVLDVLRNSLAACGISTRRGKFDLHRRTPE
jgi:hypothetical protein